MDAPIEIREAQLTDQGKLGPLLIECLGPTLAREFDAARAAGIETPPVEDELMAADDFYFTSIDLMNCCYLAHDGDAVVGAAVVNPYTVELLYLVVKESHRRKGLGTRLLQAGIAEMERRGLGHIKIDLPRRLADDGAKAFFAARGFGEIREVIRLGKRLGH